MMFLFLAFQIGDHHHVRGDLCQRRKWRFRKLLVGGEDGDLEGAFELTFFFFKDKRKKNTTLFFCINSGFFFFFFFLVEMKQGKEKII